MDALTEKVKAAMDGVCPHRKDGPDHNECPRLPKDPKSRYAWPREPGDSWRGCWTCHEHDHEAQAVADAIRPLVTARG